MDRRLFLVGGGVHCKAVLDVAERLGCLSEIVVMDDNIRQGFTVLGHQFAGSDAVQKTLSERI